MNYFSYFFGNTDLVTSKEQWSVYEVYLKLVATCIVVAGLMVSVSKKFCFNYHEIFVT